MNRTEFSLLFAGFKKRLAVTRIFSILVTAFLLLANRGAAQDYISEEYRPAVRYFDLMLKKTAASGTYKSLYDMIGAAYSELNHRPNPVIGSIDTLAAKGHMSTDEMLKGIVMTSYFWKGLYDSLQYPAALKEVTPALEQYDRYLCDCTDLDDYFKPEKLNAASLRKKFDSCRANVHQWSGWPVYKKTVDSIGIAQFKGKDQNAYIAFLLKNCIAFRNLVKNDVPYIMGSSPKELQLVQVNALHSEMAEAVFKNTSLPQQYMDTKTAATLTNYLDIISKAGLNKAECSRMAFYNDKTDFYFFVPNTKGELKFLSVLSYDYRYENGAYRISNVQYQLRKNSPENADDEQLWQHLFYYPPVPVNTSGFPLNQPLPKMEVFKSRFIETLKEIDLSPPLK